MMRQLQKQKMSNAYFPHIFDIIHSGENIIGLENPRYVT